MYVCVSERKRDRRGGRERIHASLCLRYSISIFSHIANSTHLTALNQRQIREAGEGCNGETDAVYLYDALTPRLPCESIRST